MSFIPVRLFNSFQKSKCYVKMITFVYMYIGPYYCHLDRSSKVTFMPGRVVPLTAGTSVGLSANAQSFSM